MNSRDLVKLLARTQDALEELDRVNVATARSHIFDLNWQLRELIKRAEQLERGDVSE